MSATDDMAVAKARIAEEAKQQTGSLDLSVLEIAALPEEIRALTALRALDLNKTQVSDLTPLASLTALQSLSCRSTQVSDLTPLASLTALQTLNCRSTQVSDLAPLAGLTALQALDLNETQVSDLTPLASLTALQSLTCWYTQVSDLTPLASLTALQTLDCDLTQVSDLTPLASLTALQSLSCNYTQVSDLTPLASMTALQSLNCRSPQVSDLTPLASLTALQSLDCSSTQVSDLTPLTGLTALQSLTCWSTQVSDLTPLASLAALQSLDCGNTQVSDLTPLASLTALQSLDCGNTQVSDLTPLASLTALQSLDCGNTQVSDLTPLASLTALQSLTCSPTQVSDLTPLASLTALHSLDCGSTQVSDLTPLASLTALQSLDCDFTQVSDLTPLASLTALQSLDCGSTQVSDLTPLASLTALQSLDCDFTQVSDLTPLASLTALQSLDCISTQVSDLTPLASLTALQRLDCRSTQVSDLKPLASLTALQSLNCDFTKVSDLTPLASLTALQKLNVSSCRLVTLPACIIDKPDLQLIAQDAHVPGLPHGLLSTNGGDDCRPRVKAHYDDLADETCELTEIKLFLLGNGGAGKTQICRWLCGETFDPNWNSTHGIVTENAQQTESIAARLHLKIWDFGGQDIYHGTHAMFMRGPAVLVPVWAKDREALKEYEHEGLTFRNHPLAYWIDVVAHQADPQSPVLIVQTKCDEKAQEERRFPVSDETLQALPYVSELRFSARTGFGGSTFEGALKDAIRWLRNPERLGFPKIGAVRLRVQRRLEAMRQADMALPCEQRQHRLLTMSEFEAICSEAGGVSSPALLLDYLDANGCVIYRPGMIRDSIVLDQSWALNAIYTVFDRKRVFGLVKSQDGRVSLADLARHVWQAHSDDEQKLLLSLMRACGMCFAHRRFGDSDDGTEEFIVPDLLPERNAVAPKLQARWAEDRPAEFAVFRYALLHGGLIRSIMAEIGELAGIDALYWRGGFFLFDADTRSRLLVEAVITEGWQGEIRARTQDGQAVVLLQKAVRLIERGQARFSMQPASIERSAPVIALSEQETRILPVAEPQTHPEWYISYAWGDDRTPEGRARAEIVDKLCAAAEADGHRILRDRDQLSLGDSISAFMNRIGSGDRVFVILSEKYLRSPFCMFELSEVWRTSKQQGDAFLKRVKIFALPDAAIWKPTDWVRWAVHWKSEFDELDALLRQHGGASFGEHPHRRLRQMQTFYTQVSDILGALADIVQPRTFEELKLYGFDDS